MPFIGSIVDVQYNKYKTEIISSKVPDGGTCTVYRCGPVRRYGEQLVTDPACRLVQGPTSAPHWIGEGI